MTRLFVEQPLTLPGLLKTNKNVYQVIHMTLKVLKYSGWMKTHLAKVGNGKSCPT